MAPTSPTFRERVGGRWVVSWPVFWVMTVAVTVTTASLEPTVLAYGANVWRWTLVVLTAVAALALLLLIAGATVMRNRAIRPVPLWVVVVLGSLMGITRMVVLIQMCPVVGLPEVASPVTRIVGSAVIAPVVLVLVVVLIDELDRRRMATRLWQQRLVDVRATEVERDGLVATMTDRVYAEVLEVTASARADLDAPYDAMPAAERMQAAARLRQTVAEELRPLSHRLDAARAQPLPEVSLWQAMRRVFRADALQPVWAATLATVLAIPLLRLEEGWWVFLLIAVTFWMLVYLPMALAKALARRGGVLRDYSLLIGIGMVVVVGTARLAVVAALVGYQPGIRYLGNAVWLVVAVLITATLGVLFGGEQEMADELEREVDRRAVDAAVADRELARVSRDMAQYVHGTLQGTLLATAFAIEDATNRGDDADLARTLEQARRALGAQAPVTIPAATVATEVEDRAAMWRGFTAVDVRVDPALGGLAPGTIADVGRVVEEAIGNAHKHGAAARVEVLVRPVEPGVVRVQVSDDGVGPGGGMHGMGFTWLDFAAPGNWQLERGGPYGGSVLTVDLPRGA